MNRSVYCNWSSASSGEGNHRVEIVSCCAIGVEYKVLWFEQPSITRPGSSCDGKWSGQLPFVHICWLRDVMYISYQLSVAVKVPSVNRIDRCITNWSSYPSDQEGVWSLVVSCTVISWIQVLLIQNNYHLRQVLVMVKWSDEGHWSLSVLKIFVSTSVQLSVAVKVPSVNESIGVIQLIVVSFGQKVI